MGMLAPYRIPTVISRRFDTGSTETDIPRYPEPSRGILIDPIKLF
jgi:hypothetical protein